MAESAANCVSSHSRIPIERSVVKGHLSKGGFGGEAILEHRDHGEGYETRGSYAGTGGDLKVTPAQDGSTVTFSGLSGDAIHTIAAARVWATGTTALNILALF